MRKVLVSSQGCSRVYFSWASGPESDFEGDFASIEAHNILAQGFYV